MKKIIILAFISIVVTSCNKQIDAIRPLVRIDADGQLATLVGIQEATNGNYNLLNASGPLLNLSESRGNTVTIKEFQQVTQDNDAFLFANNTEPSLGYSYSVFRQSYQIIFATNIVLEGIEKFEQGPYATLSAANQEKIRYAKGENLFLRAFTYFNLIRIYGKPYYQNAASSSGVPIKTSTDVNDKPAPSSVEEVYDLIITDLKAAASLMKGTVVKTNSFVNVETTWALLSRVYLYMGGTVSAPDLTYNQLAADYADSVIVRSTKYQLLQGTAYRNMFADDQAGTLGRDVFASNKEIIFALDNRNGSTIGHQFRYDPSSGGGFLFPSNDLKAQFVTADVRKTFYKINPSTGFEETTKYLTKNQFNVTYSPLIFFRLGEMYLNRAEANAKLGKFTQARADLKAIHTRAGLPASDIDVLPNADILAAVLKERRLELAFEGHNSFDYYRNGLPMTRIASDYNGTALTVQPTDPKIVFPIPTF